MSHQERNQEVPAHVCTNTPQERERFGNGNTHASHNQQRPRFSRGMIQQLQKEPRSTPKAAETWAKDESQVLQDPEGNELL